MKRIMTFGVSIVFFVGIMGGWLRAEENQLKAFPPAEPGMVRHVLNLTPQRIENDFRVELIIGKMVKTDERNIYFFGGKLETKTVKGWGFDYFLLEKLGPMAGTLMAVEPEAKKVDRFISLKGEPFLVRYNSRLPLVIYVPEGVEVRYRIWKAGEELRMVPKG